MSSLWNFCGWIQDVSPAKTFLAATMEDKILRTINTLCLNFSPFPPTSVVVCAPLYTLPCPKSVCSSQHCLEGGGEGQYCCGIQVVREVNIMLHLNIWQGKDVEGRFFITVPRIFVLHCRRNERQLISQASPRAIFVIIVISHCPQEYFTTSTWGC